MIVNIFQNGFRMINLWMLNFQLKAKIYSAIWKDGRIEEWDQELNKWKRSEPLKVAIKVLNNSENPSNKDFLSEVR